MSDKSSQLMDLKKMCLKTKISAILLASVMFYKAQVRLLLFCSFAFLNIVYSKKSLMVEDYKHVCNKDYMNYTVDIKNVNNGFVFNMAGYVLKRIKKVLVGSLKSKAVINNNFFLYFLFNLKVFLKLDLKPNNINEGKNVILLKRTEDWCRYSKKGKQGDWLMSFIMSIFKSYSNLTMGCPIKPGYYTIQNLTVDMSFVPIFVTIPSAKFNFETTFRTYDKNKLTDFIKILYNVSIKDI